MTNLQFGKHDIPSAILSQHLIVLGKTGAGKSSVLRLLVESLLHDQKPVCIIDPKGDWWGLKSSADGKHAGYPVVIFGGDHADVPLNSHAGAQIAELVATGNRPCIVDVGMLTMGERTRFFIDFAAGLFRYSRGPRWLIIDEVHNFAPQGKVLDPDAGKMLHWANRLASEGRGKGIQLIAASQRPQKVHKDFVTSCETLIAMRVIHPLDRGAIKDWIDGCPDRDKGREVLESLASMPRGTGWVWSPEIGFGPDRIAFPLFKTYDSFKAPTGEAVGKLKGWAEVDLDDVKRRLSEVVEEAKANDPKLLRKRIAELEDQLASKPVEKPEVQVERVEVSVLKDEQIARLEAVATLISQAGLELTAAACEISQALLKATKQPTPARAPAQSRASVAQATPVRRETVARSTGNASKSESLGAFTPNSAQQRILDALAWYESLGDDAPSLIKIGAVALLDPTGGYFSNTVGPLITNDLVIRGNGRLTLTDSGRERAKAPERATSLAAYHDVLRQRVRKMKSASGKTIAILDAIVDMRGAQLTTDEIGSAVGIDHTGGYFSNSIGPLTTAGLIQRKGGVVTPTDVLFPGGLK